MHLLLFIYSEKGNQSKKSLNLDASQREVGDETKVKIYHSNLDLSLVSVFRTFAPRNSFRFALDYEIRSPELRFVRFRLSMYNCEVLSMRNRSETIARSWSLRDAPLYRQL